jgi:hypothetical protein
MENYNQSNTMQESSGVKVRTPAALFSKSKVRSPMHNRRTSSVSQVTPICANHPQKDAVFFIHS